VFAPCSVVLCIIGLFASAWVPNSLGHTIGVVAILALGGAAAATWGVLARFPEAETKHLVRLFGTVALVAGCVLVVRVGAFSPVPATIILGISFFGRCEDRRYVVALSGLAIAFHLGLGTLLSFDLIPDTAAYGPRSYISSGARIGVTLVTAAVYVAAVLHARQSRRAARHLIQLARTAALDAHRREAQLKEAQLDLERALRAAATSGRWTGCIAGAWRIGDVVGRGAMGEVYEARHVTTGQRAAIKLLHVETSLDDPAAKVRLLREARVATAVRAPSLTSVFEVGEMAGGEPFVVMELLSGRDLGWRLRRSPKLALADVVDLVRDVAAGLSAAHAAGVVHRDLKPSNLFLTEGGRWKVLDFGVCTFAESNGTLTSDGMVGTPAYMAPEQIRGEKCTPETDLYALGAVAYRALTGQLPYPGATTAEILGRVLFESPARPSALAPELAEDIERVLAIALAKEKAERFPDAIAFANAFVAAAAGTLAPELRARAAALDTFQAKSELTESLM
jgi:serine/threonine-protein kinase